MADISLEKASFVALWVETLLYGAYLVLFSICVYILLYISHRPGRPVNKPLLITTIVMFILSTTHICVSFLRGLTAFIGNEQMPSGAVQYYAQIWLWLNIFKQALYATNNIVADGLVIYRCYVVWGSNWKIITAPLSMLIATTICAYAAVYNFSIIRPGQDVFASNIAEWGTALFSLSLATNITVTSLIAARIWWISHRSNALLGKRHVQKYNNVVAIILESGAIYSVSLMTLLILYCRQTNAQYIVYDSLAQIMAIVPTLIIVRVGLGVSTEDNETFATGTGNQFSSTVYSGHSNVPPIAMQVRKIVEIDDDFNHHDGNRMRKVDLYSTDPPRHRV